MKHKNLNPEWNEEFSMVVKDPESQVGKHEKMAINVMLYAFRKVVIPGFGVDWSFLFLPMTAEVCYFSHSAGLVFLNRSNEREAFKRITEFVCLKNQKRLG
nr:synaptotagmin-1-like isoform X1 [Ipomoea batatas]